jgi:hypothetical protein
MPTTPRQLSRSTLAALLGALVCASCGGDSSNADPYNGVVFVTDGAAFAWDAKFLASTTCPKGVSSPCYVPQTGWVNGNVIGFYNLLPTLASSKSTSPGSIVPPVVSGFPTPTTIPLTAADHHADGSGGQHVDSIAACAAAASYDPRLEAYSNLTQMPVWDSLPFVNSGTVWPIVSTFSVTGVDSLACNTIKDSRSIANATDPAGTSSYGATRSATPTGYSLLVPLDPTATVASVQTKAAAGTNPAVFYSQTPKNGWYRGLQVTYLDGGPIPTDSASAPTQFVPMDGFILNKGTTPPATSADTAETVVSKLTASGQIVLPFGPGDAGYSPIVRLHPLTVAAAGPAITAVCQAAPCAPGSALISAAGKSDFTIFIVSNK